MKQRHPLAVLRVQRRISQTALATIAGVSQSYVARIERGWRLAYPTDGIRRIAEALDVPIEAIVAPGQVEHDDAEMAAHWFGLDPENPATRPYLSKLREGVLA